MVILYYLPLTCLFVLRLNVPVNNYSVIFGQSQCFLGLTSNVGSKCVLLKDTTRCCLGPLDSESDALPLCHRAINFKVIFKVQTLNDLPQYDANGAATSANLYQD